MTYNQMYAITFNKVKISQERSNINSKNTIPNANNQINDGNNKSLNRIFHFYSFIS